ncbi:MAG: D-amino acid aminotransferase [Pelagibacterales bacterium]|nr:D-amino acid aminotransferase [Pelagibacterales bacterium]
MSRISFLNGEFLPHEKCLVHIEDRGFQFADGAYEVTLFKNGKLIDGDAHVKRLFRSLNEMKIEHNLEKENLLKMQIELFAKNNMDEGICYIQVTRGATNRVPYVPKNLPVTISATVSLGKKMTPEEFEKGVSIMTHDDIRWKRCDIKSVALFASSFINQKAKDLGFDDAIFVRDGVVTEGTFANAFIVDEAGNLVTKPADNLILQGITRNRLIEIAQENGIKVVERSFDVSELVKAKEVFLTSSSLILRPVTQIDGKVIGNGKAGEVSQKLASLYQQFTSN